MKNLLTLICALAVATCSYAQIRVNPITTNNAAGMSNVIVRAAGAWGYLSNQHSAPIVFGGSVTASNFVGKGLSLSNTTSYVDVKRDFGVVGNAFDTVRIQAALDRATNGQIVFIPAGSYTITNTLLITNNGCRLVGAGSRATILTMDGPGFINAAGVQIGNGTDRIAASVENLALYMSSDSDYEIGVHVENSGPVIIDDVYVRSNLQATNNETAVYLNGGASFVANVTIRDCFLSGHKFGVVASNAVGQVVVNASYIGGVGAMANSIGWIGVAGGGNEFSDNDWEGWDTAVWAGASESHLGDRFEGNNCNIRANSYSSSFVGGSQANGTNDFAVQNNLILQPDSIYEFGATTTNAIVRLRSYGQGTGGEYQINANYISTAPVMRLGFFGDSGTDYFSQPGYSVAMSSTVGNLNLGAASAYGINLFSGTTKNMSISNGAVRVEGTLAATGNITALGPSNYSVSVYAPTGSVTTMYAGTVNGNGSGLTNLQPSGIVSGTFSGALYTTASSATNGPANSELVAAQFVRELFAGFGASYYSTTNSDVTFTNSDIVTANTTVYQLSPVVGDYGRRSYTAPTNNEYIGQVVTTNRFLSLNAGVTVNAYLESTDGSGTAGPTIKPEIYVSYDKTNWIGDWDATAQAIPEGATNLYTWVVSNPSYTSTNATGFYIQRRFKIVAQTSPAAANVHFHLGTGKPSHITLSAADSTSGNVFLSANNVFTGSNTFSGALYSAGATYYKTASTNGDFVFGPNDTVVIMDCTNAVVFLPNCTNTPAGRVVSVIGDMGFYGACVVSNATGTQQVWYTNLSTTLYSNQSLTLINTGTKWR